MIELDPTMTEAERDHLKSDLIAAELDVARLRAALAEDANPLEDFHPPDGASPALIEMQPAISDQPDVPSSKAKLAAIERQLAQKEAERGTIAASDRQARGDDSCTGSSGSMFANISLKRNWVRSSRTSPNTRISSASSRTSWFRRAVTAKPTRRLRRSTETRVQDRSGVSPHSF